MTSPGNPTLLEIARTITAAAALHDEDPLDVASGAMGSRARWLAFAALIEAFPDVYFANIAKWCGFLDHKNAVNSRSSLKHNRDHQKWRWWREDDLAVVKAALAKAIAETEGAPTIQSSDGRADGRALKGPTGDLCEESQDTGAQAERGTRNSPVKCRPSEDAGGANPHSLTATLTEDLGRVVREPVVEPGPSETISATPVADLTEGERFQEILERSRERLKAKIAVAERAPLQNPKSEPVCQPSAAALAITAATRDMRAAKAKPKPPAAPVNVLVDERRAVNPLTRALAAERERGVTSFRPDRPAHERGAVVIPVVGEPPPGRSALDQRGGS